VANLTLYFAKCLITSYTSILAPLLPMIMLEMKLSLTQAGALISLFSLFNSLLQPLFGWAQDRLGYFFFLCFTPLWVGVFMGSAGIAPNYEWLVIFLFCAGMGICVFHPASFAAVGSASPDRRAIAISYLMFASSLGFVVGPALISLFVARFGIGNLLFIALPGVIATMALLAFVPRHSSGDLMKPKRDLNPYKAIFSPIFPLFLSALAISMTAMNLYSLVPILFRQEGLSLEMIGFFLSAFALGCAIGPMLGSLAARRFGRAKMNIWSAIFSVVFLLLFVSAQNATALKMIYFLFLGMALLSPISVLIDMAQEKAPQFISTVSSLLGGFAWGCGGILVIVFAKLAESIGIEMVVDSLIIFPLINLGLVFTSSFRSGKAMKENG
jgi:MFS family permease